MSFNSSTSVTVNNSRWKKVDQTSRKRAADAARGRAGLQGRQALMSESQDAAGSQGRQPLMDCSSDSDYHFSLTPPNTTGLPTVLPRRSLDRKRSYGAIQAAAEGRAGPATSRRRAESAAGTTNNAVPSAPRRSARIRARRERESAEGREGESSNKRQRLRHPPHECPCGAPGDDDETLCCNTCSKRFHPVCLWYTADEDPDRGRVWRYKKPEITLYPGSSDFKCWRCMGMEKLAKICSCRAPWDETRLGRLMRCGICKRPYHLRCVYIKKHTSNTMFLCDNCAHSMGHGPSPARPKPGKELPAVWNDRWTKREKAKRLGLAHHTNVDNVLRALRRNRGGAEARETLNMFAREPVALRFEYIRVTPRLFEIRVDSRERRKFTITRFLRSRFHK